MARKLRNTPRRRKAPGHASSRDRAAKDEKARYERCRRRRWGLVKKASEYNVLFGSEVFMLLKDGQKSWYFSSNDGWTSTPQDMVSGGHRPYASDLTESMQSQERFECSHLDTSTPNHARMIRVHRTHLLIVGSNPPTLANYKRSTLNL